MKQLGRTPSELGTAKSDAHEAEVVHDSLYTSFDAISIMSALLLALCVTQLALASDELVTGDTRTLLRDNVEFRLFMQEFLESPGQNFSFRVFLGKDAELTDDTGYFDIRDFLSSDEGCPAYELQNICLRKMDMVYALTKNHFPSEELVPAFIAARENGFFSVESYHYTQRLSIVFMSTSTPLIVASFMSQVMSFTHMKAHINAGNLVGFNFFLRIARPIVLINSILLMIGFITFNVSVGGWFLMKFPLSDSKSYYELRIMIYFIILPIFCAVACVGLAVKLTSLMTQNAEASAVDLGEGKSDEVTVKETDLSLEVDDGVETIEAKQLTVDNTAAAGGCLSG
jgi:hypothetical protein